MPSSLPLAGRAALVTGVSRRIGIGAAIAQRLLTDGASVLATGWEPHDAEMPWGSDPGGRAALLEQLGGERATLRYRPADLEDPDEASQLATAGGTTADDLIQRFGGGS